MTDERRAALAELIEIEGVSKEELASLITVPPERSNGDYTLPCFRFAKLLRKSPAVIAQEIADKIQTPQGDLVKVVAVNG